MTTPARPGTHSLIRLSKQGLSLSAGYLFIISCFHASVVGSCSTLFLLISHYCCDLYDSCLGSSAYFRLGSLEEAYACLDQSLPDSLCLYGILEVSIFMHVQCVILGTLIGFTAFLMLALSPCWYSTIENCRCSRAGAKGSTTSYSVHEARSS